MTLAAKAEAYVERAVDQTPLSMGYDADPVHTSGAIEEAFFAGAKAVLESPEVQGLVGALECVKAHDYMRADLFDTAKNTLDEALSAFSQLTREVGE